jgi:hypothetical protein
MSKFSLTAAAAAGFVLVHSFVALAELPAAPVPGTDLALEMAANEAQAASTAAAAPRTASVCKGLVETACSAISACKWQPERIKGLTKTAAGALAKTNAKAHCRKAPAAPTKAN